MSHRSEAAMYNLSILACGCGTKTPARMPQTTVQNCSTTHSPMACGPRKAHR